MNTRNSQFQWDQSGNQPILRLHGNLGSGIAQALLESFLHLPESTRSIVVECQNANFISTAVLQVLISAGRTLSACGGKLRIVNPSDDLVQWSKLGGWSGLFHQEIA